MIVRETREATEASSTAWSFGILSGPKLQSTTRTMTVNIATLLTDFLNYFKVSEEKWRNRRPPKNFLQNRRKWRLQDTFASHSGHEECQAFCLQSWKVMFSSQWWMPSTWHVRNVNVSSLANFQARQSRRNGRIRTWRVISASFQRMTGCSISFFLTGGWWVTENCWGCHTRGKCKRLNMGKKHAWIIWCRMYNMYNVQIWKEVYGKKWMHDLRMFSQIRIPLFGSFRAMSQMSHSWFKTRKNNSSHQKIYNKKSKKNKRVYTDTSTRIVIFPQANWRQPQKAQTMAARPEGRSLVWEFPGTQHNKRQHGNQKELETEKNILLKVWHCIKWFMTQHDQLNQCLEHDNTWQHKIQNPPFPGLNLIDSATKVAGHMSLRPWLFDQASTKSAGLPSEKRQKIERLEMTWTSRTSCLYQIDHGSMVLYFQLDQWSQSKWTRNGMLSSLSEFHEIEYALNWCDYWIGFLVPTKWRALWTLDQVLKALTTAKCK